jgi:hypothetical protein
LQDELLLKTRDLPNKPNWRKRGPSLLVTEKKMRREECDKQVKMGESRFDLMEGDSVHDSTKF